MEVKERLMMGKVTKAIIVTKPQQLPKLDTGPIHIILGPNLKTKDKGNKNE